MNWVKLNEILSAEPIYRFKQIQRLLFCNLLTDWAEATSLSKSLRTKLAESAPLDFNAEFVDDAASARTSKALLTLADGEKVETVLINYGQRLTVCVSTQVGCGMGCAFCATGRLGFRRNLTAWEMVEQVHLFNLRLAPKGQRVNSVVFMGMGEPFLNYAETMKALRWLNDQTLFNIGVRHLSVSTSGIPSAIKRFAEEKFPANLAISLHAAEDKKRLALMPRAGKFPLKELMNALDYYLSKTNRKVMIEYILLSGVNDTQADAEALAACLKNRLVMVNLLPYNKIQDGEFKASSSDRRRLFANWLKRQGIEVFVRDSRGGAIKAACGQLAGEN